MKKNYIDELKNGIEQLRTELAHMQSVISTAKSNDDTAEYTKLMSTFLATQKQYLKLCSELEDQD